MNDPQVQAAIASAAKDQASAVGQVLKDQGPDLAKQALAKAKEMANDPQVQEQARAYAAEALKYAAGAGDKMLGLIEQGPAGVRLFAFGAGVASAVNAVLTVINPLNAAFGPITYVISLYMFVFGLSTALFEAPPEYIEQVKAVSEYQDLLNVKCAFLADVAGRGLFYIFQGSLWLGFASLHILNIIVGLALCFIGGIHVAMHFGVMPKHVAEKMRSYVPLSAEPATA